MFTSFHRLVLVYTKNSHQVIDDGTMSEQGRVNIIREIGLKQES